MYDPRRATGGGQRAWGCWSVPVGHLENPPGHSGARCWQLDFLQSSAENSSFKRTSASQPTTGEREWKRNCTTCAMFCRGAASVQSTLCRAKRDGQGGRQLTFSSASHGLQRLPAPPPCPPLRSISTAPKRTPFLLSLAACSGGGKALSHTTHMTLRRHNCCANGIYFLSASERRMARSVFVCVCVCVRRRASER